MISYDIYSILQTIPHNPHYLKRYYSFILYCQNKNQSLDKDTYTENHHICPRAKDLFPEYDKLSWNKIILTAKQHYIAHHLLWKSYSHSSMSYAFKCFIDGYTSKCHKREKCFINSNTYSRLKEENSKYNSLNKKNKVTVLNIKTNERFVVSKEEFDNNDDLVGACTGMHLFKTEETKMKMRKPKSKEHADKIRRKNILMHSTPFVCCLVTKKTYTLNTWTKHYKILYEPGYAEFLGKISSDNLKGKSKSPEHIKNMIIAKKENNRINRVCDITTHKEYSISSFKKIIRERENYMLNGYDSGDVYDINTHKKYNIANFRRWVLKIL